MNFADRIAPLAERISDLNDIATRQLGSLVDFAMRVWLAQHLFRSGILRLTDPEPTVWLFTFVFPIDAVTPETAAGLLTSLELIAPVFLLVGLLSRIAAVAIFVSAALSYIAYPNVIDHLAVMAMLGLIVASGPGAISLDHKFLPALANSALPFTRLSEIIRSALTTFIAPVYAVILRLGLAVLFSAPVFGWAISERYGLAFFSDMELSLTQLTLGTIVLFAATLLAVGLLARMASVGLAILLTVLALLGGDGGQAALAILLLLTIAGNGGGILSLDYVLLRAARRYIPSLRPNAAWLADAPHVVIVGGGFGGIAAALGLRRTHANVTLIDRRNYHLFQPLLYQVATASLSPADIATPIRSLVRGAANCRVVMGRVIDVDTGAQNVVMDDQAIAYDYLVLATGAKHSYFGKDEWEPFAPGLKKIDDATEIRREILTAFENAETTDNISERERLMTFVIVGGGPTGVELAGAIAELARLGMTGEFNNIDPRDAHIILVQSAPRILPAMPEGLSKNAHDALQRLGVDVRVQHRVEEIDARGVIIGGERINAGIVVWAAGVAASPAGRWVDGERDRAGRVLVNQDLGVGAYNNIFAIGDTASCANGEKGPLPGLAAVAKQQGAFISRHLRAQIEGRPGPGEFRYKDYGSMATIGREKAVADLRGIKLSGIPAWWLWSVVHVAFMADARNRTSVILDWVWSYLTFSRRNRLITGGP